MSDARERAAEIMYEARAAWRLSYDPVDVDGPSMSEAQIDALAASGFSLVSTDEIESLRSDLAALGDRPPRSHCDALARAVHDLIVELHGGNGHRWDVEDCKLGCVEHATLAGVIGMIDETMNGDDDAA